MKPTRKVGEAYEMMMNTSQAHTSFILLSQLQKQ